MCLLGLKSANCTHKIHDMVKIAKGVGRLLTVIVFEGETVTPHVSCCPICAYVVKNNYSFLNHTIVGH